MSLDRFYPIFEDAQWIARMLPLGIKLVQLRMKDRSVADIRENIKISRDLCAKHGATLVVNDFWQDAIDLKCDWVHLGQGDLDTADIPALRRANIKIGISTHDHEELDRALRLSPDYIALGPIYPTRLKKMKWHEQGTAKLTEWRKRVGATPLVAIGGLTIARAADCFAAGADICSVVTDITLDPAPEQKLAQWLNATRSNMKEPK